MQRLLITGGTGLIGYEVIKLLSNSYDVYVISRDSRQKFENCTSVFLDFTQEINLASLPDRMDVVIHLAQSSDFRNFPDKAIDVFYVNTLSTLNLLSYSQKAGVKKFIYASSGGIYGFKDKIISELTEPEIQNRDLYITTKVSSELLVNNYSKCFDVVSLRFFFVYGWRQSKRMLIPRLISNVREGKIIELEGKDGIIINPIYVEDAAKAVVAAITLKGCHTFNIAGPQKTSLLEIVESIGRHLGLVPNLKVDLGKENKWMLADIGLMKDFLHVPAVNVNEGLEKTIFNG